MADKQWKSDANGDISVGANWNGGAPANGDRLFFNTGSVAVTSGSLALSALTVVITDNYTGNLGTSSFDVDFGHEIDKLLFSHGGSEAWLKVVTLHRADISGGQGGANMLQLNVTTSCPVVYVGDASGTLTFRNSSDLEKLVSTSPFSSVQIITGSGMTSLSAGTIELAGGRMTAGTIADTARLYGTAFCSVQPTTTTAQGIDTILEVKGNSTCEYKASGTIAKLEVGGPQGLFDGRENATASNVTISLATAFRGGTINLDNGQQNWVLTSGVKTLGGLFIPGYGADVQLI